MLFITIIDKDIQYAKALAHSLSCLYQGLSISVQDTVSISDKLSVQVSAHTGQADFDLPDRDTQLSELVITAELYADRIKELYPDTTCIVELTAELRYAGCARIMDELRSALIDRGMPLPTSVQKETKMPDIVCFIYPSGGIDGCLISFALACELASHGERILYLSRDRYPLNVSSGDLHELPCDAKLTSADYYLFTYLSGDDAKISTLHAFMRSDNSAKPLYFEYPAGENPFLELDAAEFIDMIMRLAKGCAIDRIIIDRDIPNKLMQGKGSRVLISPYPDTRLAHVSAIRTSSELEGVPLIELAIVPTRDDADAWAGDLYPDASMVIGKDAIPYQLTDDILTINDYSGIHDLAAALDNAITSEVYDD